MRSLAPRGGLGRPQPVRGGLRRARLPLHCAAGRPPPLRGRANGPCTPRSFRLRSDYPAVRYYPPSGDLYFDILTRLGEVASFETVEAETKEIEGARVSVATPLALYRLKKGTVRPKDHQDAAALRERFNLKDDED